MAPAQKGAQGPLRIRDQRALDHAGLIPNPIPGWIDAGAVGWGQAMGGQQNVGGFAVNYAQPLQGAQSYTASTLTSALK